MVVRPQPYLPLPLQDSLCLPGSARLVGKFGAGFPHRRQHYHIEEKQVGERVGQQPGIPPRMPRSWVENKESRKVGTIEKGSQVQWTRGEVVGVSSFVLMFLSQRRGVYLLGEQHYCCLRSFRKPAAVYTSSRTAGSSIVGLHLCSMFTATRGPVVAAELIC